MAITVITTNVFSGRAHIESIIRNLAVQTRKDFEWVFVDAFYDDNKQLVIDLAASHSLANVVHVPICAATHVGRKYHWEAYNNAVLLSSNPAFLRLGVYRYFHHQVVEIVSAQAEKNTWVSLSQQNADGFENLNHEEMVNKYNLEVNTTTSWNEMKSQCGMFSFSREKLVEMNGNNEALLIHHWEDCDFNSRWVQLKDVKLFCLEKALLRVNHNKGDRQQGQYIGKEVCNRSENSNCIFYPWDNRLLELYAFPKTNWFEYNGFRWAKCDVCGTVAVGHQDKYFHYLKTDPRGYQAPINVEGVGRNIGTLNDDMSKLTCLSSKVDMLASSHTDPRYLC